MDSGPAKPGSPARPARLAKRPAPLARIAPTACILLLGLCVHSVVAASVSLDCRYEQVADPVDGLRPTEEPMEMRFTIDREANTARMRRGDFVTDVELRFSQRHLTLMQTTANDSLFVTLIVFDAFDDSDLYRSVHSRHAMIGGLGELRASQYYGRCEPVADSSGSAGR